MLITGLVKKFPAFYGTRKVHYRVHKRPPLVPILNQMNPVYSFPIHSNMDLDKIGYRDLYPNLLAEFYFRFYQSDVKRMS
jgi:hypothetical protein